SKTASAGAWKVRSMRSVLVSVMSAVLVGEAGASLSRRPPRAVRRPLRSPKGAPPPAARRRCERSRARARRAALRLGALDLLGHALRRGRRGFARLVVLVMAPPPPVGRGLR